MLTPTSLQASSRVLHKLQMGRRGLADAYIQCITVIKMSCDKNMDLDKVLIGLVLPLLFGEVDKNFSE